MSAYYNEFDPFAAQWLRELIKKGLIADGEVDERSITDVQPEDIREFTQCHFFAGIGVWSYSLRQAGWADDRPVWTGSCPCQPFSSAGKGKGFKDERHLWPEFYRLISQCRPTVCFGEQVASKDGLTWVELVQTNMENAGYAFGAVDTCAAGVGAPHIRQRLYWVSHAICQGFSGHRGLIEESLSEGREREKRHSTKNCGEGAGLKQKTNGFWRDADWLFYSDRKWRPVEPSFKQMADGIALGMGYLCNSSHAIEKEEVINEAATDSYTREVLRKMREANCPEAVWLQIGRQIGFYEATLLLTCVLKYAGKLGDFINCIAQGSAEEGKRILRNMWKEWPTTSPSQRFESGEQSPDKLTNTLRKLPQEDSLEILKTLNGSPLASKAPARVGRLRGYGNAINAEQAKAFIEAYLEIG